MLEGDVLVCPAPPSRMGLRWKGGSLGLGLGDSSTHPPRAPSRGKGQSITEHLLPQAQGLCMD